MAYTDEQLRYDVVLRNIFGGMLTGDMDRDAWVYREAEDLHARMVLNAIRDEAVAAVILAEAPLVREAMFHLRYGVSHRTTFISVAFKRLVATAPPKRTDPVPLDDVNALASDLNVIYLNIRGTLDNFAWAVRAQNPSGLADRLRPQDIDLFGRRFLDAISSDVLRTALEPFRCWYGDIKGRRDPAAHRIPLSVPPSMLDEAAQREYEEVDQRHAVAMREALAATRQGIEDDRPFDLATAGAIGELFDAAGTIHAKRQMIGRFPGLFTHHPDEPATPIYPTVPEDIRNLVAIARLVSAFIESGLVSPAAA